MTNLTKLQLGLLTSAAERPNGNLLPAPEVLGVAPNRARRAAGQLIHLGFAEERPVTEQPASWRTNGETLVGAFVTDTGRQQIAPEEREVTCAAPPRQTKAKLLVELLGAPEGASLDELVAATSWLPHTTRAAITMLKKKGHTIARFGERGASRYRIVSAV